MIISFEKLSQLLARSETLFIFDDIVADDITAHCLVKRR